MTKKGFFLGSILSFALVSVGSAQSNVAFAGNGENYTKSQVKFLAQTAHTSGEYSALASYYWNQQADYNQRAKAVHHEWVHQWQITTYHPSKYPTPADSARYVYDQYVQKAARASALSVKYSQLAQTSDPAMQ